jgi:hypothetical protein
MNHDSTSPYKIQKKTHTESHTSNYNESKSKESSRRLLHTGSVFDPNLSSPPNEFIQKLKLRMDIYYDAPVMPAYNSVTLETK